MQRVLARAAIAALCSAAAITTGAQAGGRDAPVKALPAPVMPAHGDGLTRALATGRISLAEETLLRAEALFHPAHVSDRYGHVARPAGRDATLILRDLAVRLGQLSPADRKDALALLARPADPYDATTNADGWGTPEAAGSPECGADVCVHWTDTGSNAPDLTDANANGFPDWVDTTLAVAEHVWGQEVGEMGYRAPLPDTTSTDDGGDGRLDIYLSDLAPQNLYGYCTSDDPKLATLGQPGVTWDVSAYCVVDNNYTDSIFAAHTPLQNLKVTLAHEFFHAVQFGYDVGEDRWLMEGTATWMEDEVYNRINDNRQYLTTSQLRYPWVPLDRTAGCCFQYGSWIWFRFLSETIGPAVIREIWDRADGSAGAPNDYSTQAIKRVLVAHGTTFADQFARFAVWNRIPALRYSEGRNYPTPIASGRLKLGPARLSTGWLELRLNHMSSAYISLLPSRKVGRRAHLTIQLDGPSRPAMPEGSVLVLKRSGAVVVDRYTLGRRGNGVLRVPFGHRGVRSVVLALSNAGTRFDCNQGTQYSCQGTPLDNRRLFIFRARIG
jgi:hypothetical protein